MQSGNLDEYAEGLKAVAVFNLDDNVMLFEQNAQEVRPVASLTKIMTAYLAAEKLNFDDEIKITRKMVTVAPEFVTAGLRVGQNVTVEELMHMTLLPSAGDAAQALAIATTGDLDSFIELMNETAQSWGMTNTHFANTYGVDTDNYSTAEDVVKMIVKARENEKFRKVFETNEYYVKSTNTKLKKTVAETAERSGLELGFLQGAKTGYTEAAGRCLGSNGVLPATEKDLADAEIVNVDTNLIVVALGARESVTPLLDTLAYYDYFQQNYARQKIAMTGKVLAELEIRGASEESYAIMQPEDVIYYLPVERDEIAIKYLPAEKLEREEGAEGEILLANGSSETVGSLPVITNKMKEGDELGEIQYVLGDEVLYSFVATLDMEIHFINYPLIIGGSIAGGILVVGMILFGLLKRKRKHGKRGRP